MGTKTSPSVDVVIGGGGGMGSAAAYFLRALGPKDLRVLVVEQDPTYARAATALAAGGIRQHFSTPENVLMSQFGWEFLRNARDELALSSSGSGEADIRQREVPYLYLEAGAENIAGLRESFSLQRRLGCTPSWLSRDELCDRYPWITTADVDAAVLGGTGQGTFDPYALLQAFKQKAIFMGAQYRHAKITNVQKEPRGSILGVTLNGSEEVTCGAFINAAGAQAGAMAALAGIVLPVIPRRTQTFVFRAETPPAEKQFPIVVDNILGLHVRAEGNQFLAASSRDGRPENVEGCFDVDYELFDSLIWPLLAARVRAFEAIKMTSAWVGHVERHSTDSNPIIGRHPRSTNLYFLNGFSGHGAQHCPAAGRAIAELILYGTYRSIDLTRFGYERLLTASPLRERY